MERFEQSLQLDIPYPLEHLVSSENAYDLSDFLFFDIETTGLSADISSLYLIGCLYYKDGGFHMVQYFADSYDSEPEMITEFFKELANHKVLLHYNGNGFDIPYLTKKVAQHKLPYSFERIISIDLYKSVRPYKKILQLPNLKQKTIEDYLGITRQDEYNGKELIPVYGDYMKKKFKGEDNQDELSLLLLHNDEDLKGMISLLEICHYIDLFAKRHQLVELGVYDEVITAKFKLGYPLANRVKYHNEGLSLETDGDMLTIHALLFSGELKYFYPNYKDYYYLPAEDMAVHKSVAQYVDKDFKEKAKKTNCYLRKSGLFLPVINSEAADSTQKIFKPEYSSKQGFFEVTEDTLNDPYILSDYIFALLSHVK